MDDIALLREYARNGSESAFTALVERHIGLVYSAALRQVRDAQYAEDVTQAVFVVLARKAGQVARHPGLSGWLLQTARYAANAHIRAAVRRAKREQEAAMQNELNDSSPDLWAQLEPHLDEALASLGTNDRAVLALRYFENKTAAEIGQALKLSEATARKRANRALEKLRKCFVKRGVYSTATAIAGAISANSIQAAPLALAKSVTAVALAKGATTSISTLTLVKGALKIMAWTKAKTAIVAGAGLLLVAGTTTTITVKEIREHRPYSWQVRNTDYRLIVRVLDRTPPQVKIVPTIFRTPSDGYVGNYGRVLGTGMPFLVPLSIAYPISQYRIVTNTPLPEGNFDFIANLPNGNEAALQREIEKQFHLVGKLETRDTDVLLLTVRDRNAPGLKRSAASGSQSSNINNGPGFYKSVNAPFEMFAMFPEYYFGIPVLDRTGITGQFNIDLKWDETDRQHHNPEALKQALKEQLGLELVPSREPLEMLVVEKVN